MRKSTITAEVQMGTQILEISMTKEGNAVTGKAVILEKDQEIPTTISELRYTPAKRRALILYATMTKIPKRLRSGLRRPLPTITGMSLCSA